MKANLDYLPLPKQDELTKIITIIHSIAAVEMIILFGSYARNDWVEDKYDNEQYRYQSDMDLLVIVENKSESHQAKFEQTIEYQIEQDANIKTPAALPQRRGHFNPS
jgi:predicted nucleotidyltransferase